jgi:hypothetical protein
VETGCGQRGGGIDLELGDHGGMRGLGGGGAVHAEVATWDRGSRGAEVERSRGGVKTEKVKKKRTAPGRAEPRVGEATASRTKFCSPFHSFYFIFMKLNMSPIGSYLNQTMSSR